MADDLATRVSLTFAVEYVLHLQHTARAHARSRAAFARAKSSANQRFRNEDFNGISCMSRAGMGRDLIGSWRGWTCSPRCAREEEEEEEEENARDHVETDVGSGTRVWTASGCACGPLGDARVDRFGTRAWRVWTASCLLDAHGFGVRGHC